MTKNIFIPILFILATILPLSAASPEISPGAGKYLNAKPDLSHLQKYLNSVNDGILAGDTLIIGPGDEVYQVKDNQVFAGTILILGKGKMLLNSVNAVFLGDLILWGDSAEFRADKSYLYFPQSYFYERRILAAGGSRVEIKNSTMDYSGLSHNLALVDSAVYIRDNVTMKGFTTCGLYGKSQININKCNETGEFILQDSVRADFSNSAMVLLWHVADRNSFLKTQFPEGDSAVNYKLIHPTQGIENINYTVDLKNCNSVWWGLMPKPGSDIHIKNSKIRAIGLWFTEELNTNVSGLVNNTNYKYFEAELTDRSLILENTDVRTWSIYTFGRSSINLTGCILGEIGAFGRSYVNANNIMVDGSGGYFFASDTSVVVSAFSSATCNVRSERNGILLFAYSAQTNGIPASIGSSIFIAVQSSMAELPSIMENSAAWYANLNGPSRISAGDSVPIYGSAWINKTKTSYLMEFKKYFLSYQENDNSPWILIGDTVFAEVYSDVLCYWDTKGLKPGNYKLMLTLISDTQDGFKVDAQKSVNILPGMVGVDDSQSNTGISISPNPASDYIEINLGRWTPSARWSPSEINIYNSIGECIMTLGVNGRSPLQRIDISQLAAGVYYLQIGNYMKKIIVVR